MRRALFLSVCATACLVSAATAQGVPWTQHIGAARETASSTNGLFLVDRSAGTCTNISGGAINDISGVQIDDVTKGIWLGTSSVQGGANLHIIALGGGGSSVASEAPFASVTCGGVVQSVTGIAMSANNNPTVTAGDCVVEVNRGSGAQTELFNGTAAGIASSTTSGICKDPRNGNIYFGLTGTTTSAGIYCLRRLRNCTYAPAVRLGGITGVSTSNRITGIDVCPSSNEIYWTASTVNGNNIGRMSISTGVAVSSGNAGPSRWNGIEYDPRTDDFLMVQQGANQNVTSLSKTFASSTVCTRAASSSRGLVAIDTCDCSALAQTNISPACPPVGRPFTLDISTCCPARQQAATFLVSPAALAIQVGTVDITGRLSSSFRVALPPGLPPGFLVFVSVCFDPATGALVVGAPTAWPSA